MNIKAFFVDALTAALDTKIGTPDDVLRHVTPDVLAQHLPRPLWARLLTACLGAPRVDARLIVETVGIPNLCEHLPASILWACIAEVAMRSLGRAILAPPPAITNATSTPVAIGPSPSTPTPTPAAQQPLENVITELEQTDDARGQNPSRARTPTSQRFRQSSTGVARGGPGLSNARRPQAVATPAPTTLPRPSAGRRGTEINPEPEPPTAVESDWSSREIAVDDSQLIDWQTDVGSASAITGDDDFSDLGGRKR